MTAVAQMSPHIHLIEGPVGAGKSTFAKAMATHSPCVHIALDEWFARLFSPDRPDGDVTSWYIQHKHRLVDLIWDHAQSVIAAGSNVALELGLIQRRARLDFYQRVESSALDFTVHVLDAPLDLRRQRVQLRNQDRGPTFSMVVPEHIFEIASRMWEPPDEFELETYPLILVDTSAEAK
jgi:predicted kinase